MEFLTPGKRIKKIRKQLKMTQQDFDDSRMSRSYFGMIEAEKRKINIEVAKLIIERFMQRAQELGVKLEIDENTLMLSPQEEAEIYCCNKLDGNVTEEEIERIIEISRKYVLVNVEARAYKIIGDKYFENNTFSKAFAAYSTSLDLFKNINEMDIQCYLNNRLGACKYSELEYYEAIIYFNRAYQYSTIFIQKETEVKSILNIAMCYVQIGKIDKAIGYIDLYLQKIKKEENLDSYAYANILKVNCLDEKGELDQAIQLSWELIGEYKNAANSVVANIYNNLGTLYLKKGLFDESLESFNSSELIRMECDERNLNHTLIDKSMVYIKKDLYIEALMMLGLGIDYSEKYNDSEYLLRAYFITAEVYLKMNKHVTAEQYYLKIIELLKDKDDYRELLRVHLILMDINLKKGNNDMIEKYIKMSLNIIGKCGKNIL